MNRLILILEIIVFNVNVTSSQNIVNNGGFEDNPGNSYNSLNFWKKCVLSDTPDYFNDSIFSVVFSKYTGNANVHSGRGCVGFFSYRTNENKKDKPVREFIQVPLKNCLEKDSVYNIELCLLFDIESNVLCNSFAMYFSQTEVSCVKTEEILSLTPQILFSLDDYSVNNDNWSRVKGTYRAMGNESFLMLGNFNSDENSELEFTEISTDQKKHSKWNLGAGELASYLYIEQKLRISLCL